MRRMPKCPTRPRKRAVKRSTPKATGKDTQAPKGTRKGQNRAQDSKDTPKAPKGTHPPRKASTGARRARKERRGTKPLPELQRLCAALGIDLKRTRVGRDENRGRSVWTYRVPEFYEAGLPDAFKDTWSAFASLSEYCMTRGREDVRELVAYDGQLFAPTTSKGDPKLNYTQEEGVRWMTVDSD